MSLGYLYTEYISSDLFLPKQNYKHAFFEQIEYITDVESIFICLTTTYWKWKKF